MLAGLQRIPREGARLPTFVVDEPICRALRWQAEGARALGSALVGDASADADEFLTMPIVRIHGVSAPDRIRLSDRHAAATGGRGWRDTSQIGGPAAGQRDIERV